MAVKVINNTSKVFNDISKKKAPMFINAVLDIIEQQSTFRAPIAYGLLVNSKFRNSAVSNGICTGSVGYMTDYAYYLNGNEEYTPLWKPKPAPKYGKNAVGRFGPNVPIAPAMGYNPNARPSFLTSSLESPEAQADLKKAIDIFRV